MCIAIGILDIKPICIASCSNYKSPSHSMTILAMAIKPEKKKKKKKPNMYLNKENCVFWRTHIHNIA